VEGEAVRGSRAVERFIEAETIYTLLQKSWLPARLAAMLEGMDEPAVRRVLEALVGFSRELAAKNAR